MTVLASMGTPLCTVNTQKLSQSRGLRKVRADSGVLGVAQDEARKQMIALS